MAERVSAIQTCKHLIGSHFLSFSDFTPHFTPHNFLSIMAFKGHGSVVSGVTDAILQPAFGFRHGVGVNRAGSAALGPRFYDRLVKVMFLNFIVA